MVRPVHCAMRHGNTPIVMVYHWTMRLWCQCWRKAKQPTRLFANMVPPKTRRTCRPRMHRICQTQQCVRRGEVARGRHKITTLNKVSTKSGLNTICRLNPLVIFLVKVRNSFKGKYIRHLTRVLVRFPETKGMSKFTVPHFSKGESVVHRALNICKKRAEFKLNHWYG